MKITIRVLELAQSVGNPANFTLLPGRGGGDCGRAVGGHVSAVLHLRAALSALTEVDASLLHKLELSLSGKRWRWRRNALALALYTPTLAVSLDRSRALEGPPQLARDVQVPPRAADALAEHDKLPRRGGHGEQLRAGDGHAVQAQHIWWL